MHIPGALRSLTVLHLGSFPSTIAQLLQWGCGLILTDVLPLAGWWTFSSLAVGRMVNSTLSPQRPTLGFLECVACGPYAVPLLNHRTAARQYLFPCEVVWGLLVEKQKAWTCHWSTWKGAWAPASCGAKQGAGALQRGSGCQKVGTKLLKLGFKL